MAREQGNLGARRLFVVCGKYAYLQTEVQVSFLGEKREMLLLENCDYGKASLLPRDTLK